MEWRIDPLATVKDLEAVLAIEHESFTNPWTREMYLAELANEDVSQCYLARAGDGAAAGFCSFWLVMDELHINNLAVMPEFRRRGVGSALLRRVLGDAARRGVQRAMLEVRESNVEARRLYERFGFTVFAVRRRYYTHPEEDALVLGTESLPQVDGV